MTRTVEINVSVSDGELEDSGVFWLNVDPINDTPYIISEMEDITADEDFGTPISLNLNDYFGDVDEDELTYSFTQSEEGIVDIAIENSLVTISSLLDIYGSTSVTVTADDGNARLRRTNSRDQISQSFSITVAPVNDAPVLVSIENQTMLEDEVHEITLSATDVDNTQEELSFSASTNEDNVGVEVEGNLLTLTPNQDWIGDAIITITISDGELSDSQEFTLTVENVNDAPYIVAELEDVTVDEDFGTPISLNLNDYFGDIDEDELIYSFSQTEEGIVDVTIENSLMNISSLLDMNGTTTVTVTADDGNARLRRNNNRDQVSQSFEIVVAPVNDAPVIYEFEPEPELEISEEGEVQFSVTASDVDNENLNYTWYFDNAEMDETTASYTHFFDTNGVYEVVCEVDDGELLVENSWIITVDITSADNDVEVPQSTELVGNYPNPFNPTTTIRFGLHQDMRVRIDIYNLIGQKIITLLDSEVSAGYHSIEWNGDDITGKKVVSGIYYYRMRTESKNSIKKMLLLK